MKEKKRRKNIACSEPRQPKDYREYDMTVLDGLIGYGIGCLGTFLVFLIFYGNWIAAAAASIPAGYVSLRFWKQYRIRKQKEKLLLQFRDFLEALSASYSAGKNTYAALQSSLTDLERMYGESEDMVVELKNLLLAYQNGHAIEDSLYDLAYRSGLEDILSFADVFETCNRKGADMRRIINDTRRVIIEKIEMEQDIRLLLSPGKSELKLMMIMPLVMILVVNAGGLIPESSGMTNLLVKAGGMVVFLIALAIGYKITDIRV